MISWEPEAPLIVIGLLNSKVRQSALSPFLACTSTVAFKVEEVHSRSIEALSNWSTLEAALKELAATTWASKNG